MRYIIFGLCYIAFFVGGTVMGIGDTYEGDIYTWGLPIKVFIFIAFPFLCGFLGGLNYDK